MVYLLVINTLLLLALLAKPVRNHRRIERLMKEIRNQMATQEERLRSIAANVRLVMEKLDTLKTNNPQIEDEISEIEGLLAPAQSAPTPEPEPET